MENHDIIIWKHTFIASHFKNSTHAYTNKTHMTRDEVIAPQTNLLCNDGSQN